MSQPTIPTFVNNTEYPYKPGSIKYIRLTNFMCHDTFELSLGPRVNFIIGPNGSGKSALLTAIVVAFGGRATITNRAKRNDEFVMYGKRQAKITVVIHNYDKIMEKDQAFKPDDYGKFVTIEKTITKDGDAKLVLKNDKDKKVSERKQELDELLEHFGILINNPICILNQEISKTFLHSKRPEDKFDLFMKATNLEQIEEDYENAKKCHKDWDVCNKSKTFAYKMLDGELKSCEEKLTFLRTRAKLNDDRERLNRDLLWACARDNEEIGETVKKNLKDITKQITEAETEISDKEAKIKNHEEDIQIMKAKVQSIQKRIDDTKTKIGDIRKKEANLNQFDVKQRVEGCKRRILRFKDDKASLEKTIADMKREFRNQNALDQDNEQRKKEIETLSKEEIPREVAREKVLRSQTSQLNESMVSLRADIHAANERVSAIKNRISSNNALLRRLKNGQQNQLRKYGDLIIKVRDEIDIAYSRRMFKKKPIGPIGYSLKLKSQDIAASLEHLLGKNAHAFTCDNMEDMAVLNSIFKKFSTSREFRQPTIITRSFKPRHDTSKYKALHDRYKTMLDYLDVDNDAVFNCLVDRCSLESVLFIPDYKDAESLMIDPDLVPKNTRSAYTKDCCVMYPRTAHSGYKAFTNSTRTYVLFSDSNMSQIREVEDDIQKANVDLRTAENVVSQIQDSMKSQRLEYDENTAELRRIVADIRKKEERLLTLRTTITKEPQELSALEAELETFITSISNEENNLLNESKVLSELDVEVADLRKEIEACKDIMKLYEKEKQTFHKSMDESKKSVDVAKNIIKELNIKIENRKKSKEEYSKKLDEALENLARSKRGIPEGSVRPRQLGKTADIKEEIKKIDSMLRFEQEESRNPEELLASLTKRMEEIKNLTSLKDANLFNFTLSKNSLEQRRGGYIRLRDNTVHSVGATFSTVMRTMKMNGELQIYMDEVVVGGDVVKRARTLDMKIDTNYTPSQRVGSVMSDNVSNTEASRVSRSQPANIGPSRAKRSRTSATNGGNLDSSMSEKENSNKMTDARSLSGGERSFSTVAFVLALWHHCHSPFKLMDEIDVFMDMVTRRMSYNALIRFAQVHEDPGQFIFFSPLELPKFDDSGNFVRVFEMAAVIRKRPLEGGVEEAAEVATA